MIIALLTTLLATAQAQLSATLANATLTVYPTATLTLYNDPTSYFYPNDYYRNIEVSTNNIYTLGTNNIVEIYQKSNPAIKVQTFTNYSNSNFLPFSMVSLSVNQSENLLILSSFYNQTLQHLLFSLNQSGISTRLNLTGNHSFSTQPSKIFLKGTKLYTYFTSTTGNDFINIEDFTNNNSYTITMTVANCKLAVTPNRLKAVAWNNRSRLYIYSIDNNLTLQYIYNVSLNSAAFRTDTISFSSDSQLAVLQSDNSNPVRVINLTSFSTVANITIHGTIQSSTFLDPDNRFILIKASTGDYVYDLKTVTLNQLNGSLPTSTFSADSSVGQLFSTINNAIQCYGMNLIDGNTSLMSYSPPVQIILINQTSNSTNSSSSPVNQTSNFTNSSSTPPVLAPPVNETSNLTNSTSPTLIPSSTQPEFTDSSQIASFTLILNYSGTINATLDQIGGKISVVTNIIETIFSIIFSTPLAAYFFSAFNFFTLSSLYVLLNFKIPRPVFQYLSPVQKSSQQDILQSLGVSVYIQPISEERVTQPRHLYFRVTSDIFSSNLVQIILITINFILYQILIIVTGEKYLDKPKFHKLLNKERVVIYWGLIASSMIPFILPWKYILFGGFLNKLEQINISGSSILLFVLLFLVILNFFSELLKTKSTDKHRIKNTTRQWWNSYENFIYPSLLLMQSPNYFMIVIGLGCVYSFYSSFYVQNWKLLAILKASYPLLFHICFLNFMLCSDNDTLVITSVICLSVFLVGSLHHFTETIVKIIRGLINIIKHNVKCYQVKPVNSDQIQLKNSSTKTKNLLGQSQINHNTPHVTFKEPDFSNNNKKTVKMDEKTETNPTVKINKLRTQFPTHKKSKKIKTTKDKDNKQKKEVTIIWDMKKKITIVPKTK